MRCAGGRSGDGAAHPVRQDRRRREHRLLDAGRRHAAGVHAEHPLEPYPTGVAVAGLSQVVSSAWRRKGSSSGTTAGAAASRTARWRTARSMPICWTWRRLWTAWAWTGSRCRAHELQGRWPSSMRPATRSECSHLSCGACADFRQRPGSGRFRALRESDWDLYMETLAHAGAGWSAGEEARRTAAFMRECAAPEAQATAMAALWQADVTSLPPADEVAHAGAPPPGLPGARCGRRHVPCVADTGRPAGAVSRGSREPRTWRTWRRC